MMKYYKHTKTGDVYAYEQSDIDTVDRIIDLEDQLKVLQQWLADTPNLPEARAEYNQKQAETEVTQAQLDSILPVFFDIRDKLEEMVEMTTEEIEEHINPTPTPEQLAEQARAERDSLLREVDALATNPLRWGELTDEQKTEAAEYRQLLLDVPQQGSFPEEIVCPTKPSFLG